MGIERKEYDSPEQELSTTTPFRLPFLLKVSVTGCCVAMVSLCVWFTWLYIEKPSAFAPPVDFGVPTLLTISMTGLILVWIPWSKLGLKITKIGGVEFQQVLSTQASEHAEELSYLAEQIEALEDRVRQGDELAEIHEMLQGNELRDLLLKFLKHFAPTAFSPRRIRAWGSKQPGFEALGRYDFQNIRATLQKMQTENLVSTAISKQGSTLYRLY
ncbi:hypothetical protein [Marinobacter sp.]|uniref:hypothetical protein n=1 Tax=Marinobacter sp. TaxID=50741 RepID=UPI003A9160E3